MVSTLKMNLFCKKKSGRVLFAEVQEDFVLFLLSVLTFPVGYFVEHGLENPKFGCIGDLCKSIDNLEVKSIKDRNERLNLTTPFGRFFQNDSKRQSMNFYTCSDGKCRLSFTDSHGARCPQCKTKMTTKCFYVVGDHARVEGGYAVMDNLVLKPRNAVELLKECGVKNVDNVAQREVAVEKIEVLNMVRASWKSKTVLTDKFRGNRGNPTLC